MTWKINAKLEVACSSSSGGWLQSYLKELRLKIRSVRPYPLSILCIKRAPFCTWRGAKFRKGCVRFNLSCRFCCEVVGC